MPRRRQRFKRLEEQLRAANYAPAPGTKLNEYFNFKKGINKIDMTNPPTSAERVRKAVAIVPFGLPCSNPSPASEQYRAPITALSETGRTSVFGTALTNARLGYSALSPANQKSDVFYPSLLRIFNRGALDPGAKISNITKASYKRYTGRNYSIPFGRSATLITGTTSLINVTEEESRRALVDLITNVNNRAVVTHYAEQFTSPKADLASLI